MMKPQRPLVPGVAELRQTHAVLLVSVALPRMISLALVRVILSVLEL